MKCPQVATRAGDRCRSESAPPTLGRPPSPRGRRAVASDQRRATIDPRRRPSVDAGDRVPASIAAGPVIERHPRLPDPARRGPWRRRSRRQPGDRVPGGRRAARRAARRDTPPGELLRAVGHRLVAAVGGASGPALRHGLHRGRRSGRRTRRASTGDESRRMLGPRRTGSPVAAAAGRRQDHPRHPGAGGRGVRRGRSRPRRRRLAALAPRSGGRAWDALDARPRRPARARAAARGPFRRAPRSRVPCRACSCCWLAHCGRPVDGPMPTLLTTRIADARARRARRAFEDAQREADALFAQYQLSQLLASGGTPEGLATSVALELVRLAASSAARCGSAHRGGDRARPAGDRRDRRGDPGPRRPASRRRGRPRPGRPSSRGPRRRPVATSRPTILLALWPPTAGALDPDGVRVVQLARHELAVAFRGARLRETLERERQRADGRSSTARPTLIVQVDAERRVVRLNPAGARAARRQRRRRPSAGLCARSSAATSAGGHADEACPLAEVLAPADRSPIARRRSAAPDGGSGWPVATRGLRAATPGGASRTGDGDPARHLRGASPRGAARGLRRDRQPRAAHARSRSSGATPRRSSISSSTPAEQRDLRRADRPGHRPAADARDPDPRRDPSPGRSAHPGAGAGVVRGPRGSAAWRPGAVGEAIASSWRLPDDLPPIEVDAARDRPGAREPRRQRPEVRAARDAGPHRRGRRRLADRGRSTTKGSVSPRPSGRWSWSRSTGPGTSANRASRGRAWGCTSAVGWSRRMVAGCRSSDRADGLPGTRSRSRCRCCAGVVAAVARSAAPSERARRRLAADGPPDG